jgi:membrane fusion protein (multidrug efflux system)
VVEVDMALNQQKQAFGAQLEFDNPGKILKFGITADVTIKTYENPEAIVVQLKDLLKEKDNYFVYVIEKERAVKKPVVPGRQFNMDVEIQEGLSAGDKIVVEGQMLLEPDAKVRIIE